MKDRRKEHFKADQEVLIGNRKLTRFYLRASAREREREREHAREIVSEKKIW